MSRLLASLTFLLLATAAAAQSPATYDGRSRRTDVPIPRLAADLRIDGSLDEPAWQQAALLTGFSQYLPVDGRPADDPTEVLVFYTATAIHFGIRAREAHGPVVRGTLADRDNIGADDHIQILLDTYNDDRRALLFAVNPLGVQQDGVQSEGTDPSQSAGGRFDGSVDISPDFAFDSHGRLTPWGWEVEVRIPFKSLRYQAADPQQWGLQIKRITQHSGHEDTWTPAVRANASFLVQGGHLTGLTGMQRGLVLEIDPELTSSLAGSRRDDADESWHYGSPRTELGGNLRWGISSDLTLNATINPDFSQVETDVGQVTVNERFPLFFPEKRPFFLDGLEQYDTPSQLIYTRQLRDPVAGIKLTGKRGATAFAYLGAVDDRRFSFDGDHAPVFNLLRVRRDFGSSSTVGIVHTDRIEGSGYNRVSGADARIVWRKIWFSQVQVAGAWTKDASGDTRRGELWQVVFADRTGRAYGNRFALNGVSRDFETRSGFVPRTGIIDGMMANRFSFYGRPDALVQQLTTFITVQPVWHYEDFPRTGTSENEFAQQFLASLRGGWSARARWSNQHLRFDEEFYEGYRVASGVDTIALGRPRSLYGLWSGSAGISTPSRALTLSLDAGYGSGVIFPEAAEGRGRTLNLSAEWRPTAALRVQTSVVHQELERARDGSRFSTATIPRIRTEYQFSRSVFLRYIGQYVAEDRAPLVDARSGLPLLPSPLGEAVFGPSGADVVNEFRNDVLFSYKPTPGTVFFVGYGASLTEPDAFALSRDRLRRTADGFFLKASYRYRL